MALAVAVGFVLVAVVALFFLQRRMIYLPRRYEPVMDVFVERTPRLSRVVTATDAGRQVAFYLAPSDDPEATAPPERLWVLFGGNGALALDWCDMLETRDAPRVGFLLVDYPGYGDCEGRPTRATILASARAALQTLARRFDVPPSHWEGCLGVLGHSLGAAVALEFAVESASTPERVVAISPFTSLVDMARLSVGPGLNHLVRDRFDNRARLDELAERRPRPTLTLIHGNADRMIPVRMGRELAARHPDWIEYHEVPDGDHNFLLESAEPLILRSMGLGE